jgi:hypothetical protein
MKSDYLLQTESFCNYAEGPMYVLELISFIFKKNLGSFHENVEGSGLEGHTGESSNIIVAT